MKAVNKIAQHCSDRFLSRDFWAMFFVTGIYCFSVLIYFNIPGTNLGMYNLAIPLFALGILAIYRDLLPDVWQQHKRTLLLTLALYLWLWISALFGGHTATAVKYTIKYSIYFFVFPSLLTLSFKLVRDRKSQVIYLFLLGFTLLIATFGLIEYFYPKFTPLVWIRPLGFYTKDRLMSLFDSPTKLGVMMALGVLNAYVATKLKYLKPYQGFLSGLLCCIIGIASGSRNFAFSVVTATLLGIFPWKTLNKREVIIVTCISTAIAILILGTVPHLPIRILATIQDIPHNWSTFQAVLSGDKEILALDSTPPRLRIWYFASETFIQKPITGTGLNGFTIDRMGWYNAHNLFLAILSELGLIGLILFLTIIGSALWRTYIYDPRVGFLCSFIFTSQLLDFFIHDFTTIITMIWLVAAASQFRVDAELDIPSSNHL